MNIPIPNVWAEVLATSEGLMSVLVTVVAEMDKQRALALDLQHFVAARIVKYMDPAIEAWEQHHSHGELIRAWEGAMQDEISAMASRVEGGNGDELRKYVRVMMERVARDVFVRTAWDHVGEPAF
jgi:hypothetical protein